MPSEESEVKTENGGLEDIVTPKTEDQANETKEHADATTTNDKLIEYEDKEMLEAELLMSEDEYLRTKIEQWINNLRRYQRNLGVMCECCYWLVALFSSGLTKENSEVLSTPLSLFSHPLHSCRHYLTLLFEGKFWIYLLEV